MICGDRPYGVYELRSVQVQHWKTRYSDCRTLQGCLWGATARMFVGGSCKDVCVTMWMCYNSGSFSPSSFFLLPSPPFFPPCQLEVQELKYVPTSETSSEWPDSETHSEVSAEEILEGRREGGKGRGKRGGGKSIQQCKLEQYNITLFLRGTRTLCITQKCQGH